MGWEKRHAAVQCGGLCVRPRIAPGEPMYVTRHGLIRCAPCALKTFGEAPPAILAMPEGPQTMVPFPRALVAKQVREKIIDFRARRAGDE